MADELAGEQRSRSGVPEAQQQKPARHDSRQAKQGAQQTSKTLASEFPDNHDGPLSIETVKPVNSDAWPTPARRPANSRLDTGKFQESFGLRLPDWRGGVARVLDELLDKS